MEIYLQMLNKLINGTGKKMAQSQRHLRSFLVEQFIKLTAKNSILKYPKFITITFQF